MHNEKMNAHNTGMLMLNSLGTIESTTLNEQLKTVNKSWLD